jgi:hypothetical protein
MNSRSIWFGLTFLMAFGFAVFFPEAKWIDLSLGIGITGSIMLFSAVLGFLGLPMKGNADPKDVASGGAGLLLAASIMTVLT